MSVTKQHPARGGQGTGHAVPFEAFMMWLETGAKARNDTAWLEWYDGWLKNMPEGDAREDYIERSRADYERRMGETVDEYMERTRKERLAQLAKEVRAESLAERTRQNLAESLAECTKQNLAESLAERTRLDIEEGTNHQIMVENFKIFQREYVDMTVRRCV